MNTISLYWPTYVNTIIQNGNLFTNCGLGFILLFVEYFLILFYINFKNSIAVKIINSLLILFIANIWIITDFEIRTTMLIFYIVIMASIYCGITIYFTRVVGGQISGLEIEPDWEYASACIWSSSFLTITFSILDLLLSLNIRLTWPEKAWNYHFMVHLPYTDFEFNLHLLKTVFIPTIVGWSYFFRNHIMHLYNQHKNSDLFAICWVFIAYMSMLMVLYFKSQYTLWMGLFLIFLQIITHVVDDNFNNAVDRLSSSFEYFYVPQIMTFMMICSIASSYELFYRMF